MENVRAFSQAPVIILSGHPDIVRIASQLGAADYLPKPFDPDLLIDKIKLAVGAGQGNGK
jgi:FixJ family two-component response regulator